LLFATFWESEYTGWWDKTSDELQYLIQEEANLSTLNAVASILSVSAIDDPSAAKKAASFASSQAQDAAHKIIEMRQARNQALEGQAKLFSEIRLWLLCAGAVFVLLGKILFLRAYSRA